MNFLHIMFLHIGYSSDIFIFGMDQLKKKWLPQLFKKIIGGGGGGSLYSHYFFSYILEWSWTDLEIYTLLQLCHLSMCRHCYSVSSSSF